MAPTSKCRDLVHYKKYADELVAEGKAFYCFATPDEVQKSKERAALLKKAPKFVSPYRDLTPAQRDDLIKEGKSYTVRFKTPSVGLVEFATSFAVP
jgi:nondiscriminating glutamyl-tRNA synthetase